MEGALKILQHMTVDGGSPNDFTVMTVDGGSPKDFTAYDCRWREP